MTFKSPKYKNFFGKNTTVNTPNIISLFGTN